MTRWACRVGDVFRLDDVPQALVVPTPAGEPSPLRHSLLSDLAAACGVAGRLVARADGVRMLGGTGLFASVAHRPGWAAAVLARVAVGIDLETAAEAASAEAVILAGVEVDDLAAWHGLAGIWAAREAVLKAQGRDLTRDHRCWRFGHGSVTADGRTFTVEVKPLAGAVAAVAYAGS